MLIYPLAYVAIVLLVVVVGVLTAPVWTRAVRWLGKQFKAQFEDGANQLENKDSDKETK